jgi:hypothetical protein
MDRKSRRDSCRVVSGQNIEGLEIVAFDRDLWKRKVKPDAQKQKMMDAVTRVHVRSYRHDQPMPQGFSMRQMVDVKGV